MGDMKIVTVANIKGGCGKSTVALNLAVCAAHAGLRVMLVDADPQENAIDWRTLRGEDESLPQISACSMASMGLRKDVLAFSDSFDVTFIDVGAKDSGVMRASMLCADYMLIPAQPSQLDVWATVSTLKVLEECRGVRELRANILLNKCKSRARLSSEVREALSQIDEVSLLSAYLCDRQDYANSVGLGKGVVEYTPKSQASKEMQALWGEVKEILWP